MADAGKGIRDVQTIVTMRLLGGRPCLDFVNTVDARHDRWGPDLLNGFADLLVWCERIALLTEEELASARIAAAHDPDQATAALVRAKDLREAIYEVLAAVAGGRTPPEPASTSVCREIDRAEAFRSFQFANSIYAWAWQNEDPFDRPVHRIALDCAALLTDGAARARLKECFGPNCGWLFVDETRNNSRRWCSEETCGTHTRVLRYRKKRQAPL